MNRLVSEIETGRPTRERLIEMLQRTSELVSRDLDVDRIVQSVTDAAVELTGAQFGAFFYNMLNAVGESYMLYTLSGAPRSAFERYPMPRNTPVFNPTFQGEGVVRSDDITRDPRYGQNPPYTGMPEDHLPVRSYLAAPVHSRTGEVIGGLFLGHEKAGVFDAESETLIVGLAAQAAVALDNARLLQASGWELGRRRDAEQQLRLALDAAGMGDWSWDLATDLVDLSESAAAVFGVPPGPSITWTALQSHLDPVGADNARLRVLEAIESGARYDVEYLVTRPSDGRVVTVRASGQARYDADGKAVGMFGIVADITELRRSEADRKAERDRVAAIERTRSFLLGFNDQLRELKDVGDVLHLASRRLGEKLSVDRVGYGEIDDEAECVIVERDWTAPGAISVAGRHRMEDFGPALIAELRQGRAVFVDDVAEDPRTNAPEWVAAFAAIGSRTVAAVPLIRGGRFVAMLFIHHRDPHPWSEEDRQLVAQTADRTWGEVERARAESELRRNEERLRVAMRAGGMAPWEYDFAGGHLLRSAELDELVGAPGEDGRYTSKAHPEDRERIRAAIERCATDGSPLNIEWRHPDGAGGWRWIQANANTLLDDEGKPRRMVGVARDITEAKRAEQILADANRELQAAVEAALAQRAQAERDRETFWNLSRDLFGVFSNVTGQARLLNTDAWVAALGHPAEELLTGSIERFIHPEDRAPTDGIKPVLRQGAVIHGFENRYRHADGSWRWLSWSVINDGDLSYGVARDVTEEKEREIRLQRSQKLEALGQLTGGVAHDFNNLLTAIMGALDLMQKRPEDDTLRSRLLGAAMAAAKRGERLNKQLLAFARRQSMKTEHVSVDAFVTDITPLIRGAVGDTVTIDFDLGAPGAGARLDPAQFEASLLNLVVNARDAMPGGGTLRIATRPAGEAELRSHGLTRPCLAVSVSDTGTGMAPEVLARAFEPFFTTKEIGKGSGLGLAQVYGFASQAGGAVEIDSAPGRGTTVTLLLPRAEAEAADAEEDRPDSAHGRRRILLVEDDALVGVVTESMLANLGHEVVRAEDGTSAMAILDSAAEFEVLVTDLRMPGGVSGLDVARHAVARRPGIRVLLCTGWTEQGMDVQTAETGWPVLAKPFDADQLSAALYAVLYEEA